MGKKSQSRIMGSKSEWQKSCLVLLRTNVKLKLTWQGKTVNYTLLLTEASEIWLSK